MNAQTKIGDNSKTVDPEIAFSAAINDLRDEAANFLDGAPIENQGQADAVTTILDSMKALSRDAEKERKAEKQPHLDAGKAVDSKWQPLIKTAKLVTEEAQKPLTVWRTEQQRLKDLETERLRKLAEQQQLEAQEALKAANGLEQREAAEKLAESAQITERTANKIKRGPTSLTTYWEAEITDKKALLQFVMKNDPLTLTAFLEAWAAQHVRDNKTGCAGVTAHERKKAR